ncbi:MAG: protein phosphatase 2C domain-containing protein [Bacteroidia bacterium]|nr:protein phosphatase 2C domain-containing protein [Bacteroidia bacterium]MDW8333067.1 protein phosphatase 2C domain-containing protein [Bacteroidia bacterium]
MEGWTLHLERVEGLGEDAEPTWMRDERGGWIGVYDGMGGSGARRTDGGQGGETGARLAAAAAKTAAEFAAAAAAERLDEAFAQELGKTLHAALKDLDERFPNTGKIKGRLLRRFPLAFAAAALRVAADAAFYRVFWAGDARIYAWTPQTGLQQLTGDDLMRPADAFDQLYGDSPLSNCLSAEGFWRRTAAAAVASPVVFIAATDGCFHYLPSPFHFEYLLAETLLAADTPQEWKTLLARKIETLTGDDASMATAVVGFENFAALREKFAPRAALLWNEYVKPYADAVRAEGENDGNVYRPGSIVHGVELWNRYKPTYCALIPVTEAPPVVQSFDFR